MASLFDAPADIFGDDQQNAYRKYLESVRRASETFGPQQPVDPREYDNLMLLASPPGQHEEMKGRYQAYTDEINRIPFEFQSEQFRNTGFDPSPATVAIGTQGAESFKQMQNRMKEYLLQHSKNNNSTYPKPFLYDEFKAISDEMNRVAWKGTKLGRR